MDERSISRWTAFAGIATVAITVVAIAIFASLSPPADDDTPASVAAFFADNRTPILVLTYLVALSFGTNLVFFVGLRELFRERGREIDALANVGLVAGAAFVVLLFAAFAVLLQLAYREGAGDPGTQRTLFDLYSLMVTMTGVPTAVSVGAFSIAVLKSGVVARWLGWYGFAVAAAHLISMASFAREGFFTPAVMAGTVAPLMFEAWVLVFSVLLLMRAAPARSRDTAAISDAAR